MKVIIPGWLPGYYIDRDGKRQRALSNNARVDPFRKASVTSADIDKVLGNIRAIRLPNTCPWEKATVSIELIARTKSRRDWENTASMCKGLMDGIVKAGVLVDDNMDVVIDYRLKWTVDKKIAPCTIISVEPLD